MSRLESVAKAGYYPTPPAVGELVAALIRPAHPRQAVRLLDPCYGTGAALRQLSDAVGGETYGIEIARDRYEAAQAVLDHALCASAFAVRLAHWAFSCLWLNPPYDCAPRHVAWDPRLRREELGGTFLGQWLTRRGNLKGTTACH